jgi:hypothetical protein
MGVVRKAKVNESQQARGSTEKRTILRQWNKPSRKGHTMLHSTNVYLDD